MISCDGFGRTLYGSYVFWVGLYVNIGIQNILLLRYDLKYAPKKRLKLTYLAEKKELTSCTHYTVPMLLVNLVTAAFMCSVKQVA